MQEIWEWNQKYEIRVGLSLLRFEFRANFPILMGKWHTYSIVFSETCIVNLTKMSRSDVIIKKTVKKLWLDEILSKRTSMQYCLHLETRVYSRWKYDCNFMWRFNWSGLHTWHETKNISLCIEYSNRYVYSF